MSARDYFAWNMLATAAYQDEREDQGQFQADMRTQTGNPLVHLSENNFIKYYRLTKQAFEDLCVLLRYYAGLKSTQRVSLESKVLCALLFYAHGDYQRVAGKAHHFSQESISNYIEEITTALNHPDILKRFIKFPTTGTDRDTIKQSFYSKYGMPGVVGCVDGSFFKIFTPYREEEHLYFCRKHYHAINVQMICDANCKILAVNAKFGGAAHDAFIWENSNINYFMQSLHMNHEIVWLLGDSGYPQRPWIMTPYLDPTPNSIQETYNAIHTSARAVIENTFGRLKNRWRCIHRDRTLHYQPNKCAQIIIACCVLHNIALEYNVPDPVSDFVPQQSLIFERREVVIENGGASDLIMGRALRDHLAMRLAELR